MNKEELLIEAKRRYPVGTTIKLYGETTTVVKGNIYWSDTHNIIWNGSKYGRIYDNGKWAEIVSKPEENVENLYPKKYSLGKIKFKHTKPGDSIPYYYTEYNDIPKELIVHGNTILHKSYKYAEIVNYHKEFYLVKYLGNDNKYVTLGFKEESLEPYVEEVKENPKVEEQSQFEVGKWYKIHILKDSYFKFKNLIKNFDYNTIECYDRIWLGDYLSNTKISHTEAEQSSKLLTDLSEIQQYLPDGHVDKIVKPKSLIGRYLKALVDYPTSGFVKKGEYGKITSDSTADFPSQKNYSCTVAISMLSDSNTIYDGRYELMPEGFNPDEVAFGILIDLEKIKKQIIEKYPIGTCFRDLVNNEILIVKNHNFDTFGKTNQLYVPVEYNKLGNKTARIWKEGIFAEIISKAKEEIPEYVECINYFSEYKSKGKIYNTKKDKPEKSSNLTWEQILIDCDRLKDGCFKPSTKEEYDRQQNIKKQWIPKVGDWVVSLVDKEGYRKKGDVFQVLKVSDDCIYYVQNTNGYINTFRPAEPHEIPKENNVVDKEVKIDSWCVKVTKENQELLKQNRQFFNVSNNYRFCDFGYYYGIDKKGKFDISSDSAYFDKVLTTEDFCKKFNITESYKYVHIDFSKNEIIQKNQQSKINKIKVELIPVKKLIKN